MSKYEPQVVAHGACGIQWTQSGNRTGHCAKCHVTFSGEVAFDRHQSITNGVITCANPYDLDFISKPDRSTGTLIWARPYDTPWTGDEAANSSAESWDSA